MADEWIGIVNTTRPRYMKGASDLTLRSRLLLAMLRSKGRIERNASGDVCKWQVEFSQPVVNSHADGGQIDFSNHDAFRQLEIDWRGYVATDTLTKKQKAMNAGEEQLINLFQTKNNRLMKSLQNNFCGELYKNGSSSGRENNIHGLDTFLTAANTAATNRISSNNDSYGGLDTDQADQGGSWSSNLSTYPNATLAVDWPDGQGDSEYDYLSAKLVNWSASNWGTGSVLWEDNCWRVISQTITWLTVTGGKAGMPDICVLAPNLFQGYKNHEEATRRINIPHKAAQDLGFAGNVLNQDGVAISADFDCPANKGYMLNLDEVTISSIMPELFWGEGPDKDPRTMWSYLWGCGFYGNAKWNPRHVARLNNDA